MKCITIILLFTACQKKQAYNCECLNMNTGQSLKSYSIEAKDYAEAAGKCYGIQNTHTIAGVKQLDCGIR